MAARWLLLLVLAAAASQGVSAQQADQEAPTESQCRPYIEKALKELGTGSSEDADAIELVLQAESNKQPSAADDASVEDTISIEETTSVEKAEEESSELSPGDQVSESVEEQTPSAEDTASTEETSPQSVEETADSPEGGAPESVEAEGDAVSVEDGTTTDSVETEEAAPSGEEEVAPESVDESAATESSEARLDEGTGSTEKASDGEESAEEQPASAEEQAGSIEESTASVEGGISQEEQVESTEEVHGSIEQGTSAEEVAESVEGSREDAESTEGDETASIEEGATSKEDEEASKPESAEGGGISAEDQTLSGEQPASTEEKDNSADERTEEVSGSVEETASIDKEKVSEEEKDKGTEEESRSQEEIASIEEEKVSVEQASGETSPSTEDAVSTEEGEGAKSTEQSTEGVESTEQTESKERTESAEAATKEDAAASEEKGASDSAEAEGSTEQASEGEETEKSEEESPEEEELILEVEIPDNLRPREHIAQILRLDTESMEREQLLGKTQEATLRELKRVYDTAIQPLEILYKYRDLSNRHFGDPEIFSKPLILFMGPWSGGKSSIINYLLDNEYKRTALRTGAEPSPAYFNILMWGEREEVLDGTQLAADWTFSGLQKFGQGLLDRLRGLKMPSHLLEKVNIVEIPGILEIRKQVERIFPFNDACQWFIDRADIIFLVYDPSKLDVGPETEAILDQLKGREYQTRIILNKADQVRPEELMRVQGTLIWNISPLMSSTEPPVMYSTSLWSMPYEAGAPIRLLLAQERAFLRDMRDAIDKRVENKIASARRFAVRVRNHAKMVDCYLTTYYNHKGLFGSRKKISDDIIEKPQDYHIYEGLSTLKNISRYDLPDPDVYKDFFRLNPLYEFPLLSSTCTYFRGCPINRLDVAIAYDLPELVGKYRKEVDEVLAKLQPSKS